MNTLSQMFYGVKYWFAGQEAKGAALSVAVQEGNLEEVEFLLANGAPVDYRDYCARRKQPLHFAILYFRVSDAYREVAVVLLEHGASVDAAYDHDTRPLHTAASHGYREAVEFLLDHGADPAVVNLDGKTPRDLCSDEEISEMLRKAENAWADPGMRVGRAFAALREQRRQFGFLRPKGPSI